jgi:hypothetical protein
MFRRNFGATEETLARPQIKAAGGFRAVDANGGS